MRRLLSCVLATLIPLSAAAQLADPPERAGNGLVFGPKLLYYPMECQEPDGCRIECFHDGVSVVTRGDITLHDEIRLVVNAGISDEIIPRWIEIKPVSGDGIRTILLTRGTLCDFKGLLIRPRNRP